MFLNCLKNYLSNLKICNLGFIAVKSAIGPFFILHYKNER